MATEGKNTKGEHFSSESCEAMSVSEESDRDDVEVKVKEIEVQVRKTRPRAQNSISQPVLSKKNKKEDVDGKIKKEVATKTGPRKKKRARHSNSSVKMAQRMREIRKNETPKQREARLRDMKERAKKRLQNETEDERAERLAQLRYLQKTRIRSHNAKKSREKADNITSSP